MGNQGVLELSSDFTNFIRALSSCLFHATNSDSVQQTAMRCILGERRTCGKLERNLSTPLAPLAAQSPLGCPVNPVKAPSFDLLGPPRKSLQASKPSKILAKF